MRPRYVVVYAVGGFGRSDHGWQEVGSGEAAQAVHSEGSSISRTWGEAGTKDSAGTTAQAECALRFATTTDGSPRAGS